ncbi:hypothetical protein GF324_02695 [bacterium]|nr:hypothetical protein [bacterium]
MLSTKVNSMSNPLHRPAVRSSTARAFLILLSISIASLFSTGCSIQTIAVRSTGGIIDNGFDELMAEEDLVLARTAIESNLKLVEALIRTDPSNTDLILLAAQGYVSYALAFADDRNNPGRARMLYERGRDYANRWLILKFDTDLLALKRLDDFTAVVNELPDKAVPGVFWFANGWAQSILLSLVDVQAVAKLPYAETAMRFVLERDETFYYGGAHMFFGSYYGARPRMLGGDPEKAKEHFDRQREITGGEFLIGQYLELRYVALMTLDEEHARELIDEILSFDLDRRPEIRLVNRVAQDKAREIESDFEEFF